MGKSLKQLSIKRLLNTNFIDVYKFLLSNPENISSGDISKLLSVAVVLIHQDDIHLKRLGYRVVLLYGNAFNDYIPLYDMAINMGLIPVASLISKSADFSNQADRFIYNFTESYSETFKQGEITLSEEQKELHGFFIDNIANSTAIIAPTSYGKSDLIIKSIAESKSSLICIVVPSKALLAQTKKRILDANIEGLGRIVIHPDMYKENASDQIFVLTQERLSRLLHEYKNVKFDIVFIDEAHNLLDSDNRNTLLASVICILKKRNVGTAFKFLTPFLIDGNNLNIRYAPFKSLNSFKIHEYIKSEKLYLVDFRNDSQELMIYDQFVNRWFSINHLTPSKTYLDFIKDNSLSKNIIYLNKPKDIEFLAKELAEGLPSVVCEHIQKACNELADFFDKDYLLIECLKKGVAYHHGSMTETVRFYVERLFNVSPRLRYLISSSTLLEGVNLPIERLFLLSNKKGKSNLTPSQFNNLIGRVNRFGEIFHSNESGFEKLSPHIYILGTDRYLGASANLIKFMENSMLVTKTQKDKLVNPLLENTEITDVNKSKLDQAAERLENLESGTIPDYEFRYANTDIGKLLFSNNIDEIDIFQYEQEITNHIDSYRNMYPPIDNSNLLFEAINVCFITFIKRTNEKSELVRLSNIQTQRFYSMLLDWKIKNFPFKQMIFLMLRRWENNIESDLNTLEFVGKWGEETFDQSHNNYWVRMANKSHKERVNLAIVRLKEEDDFFDYRIFRFIDALNDIELIESNFYKQVRYGTTDERKIALIKNGFQRSLADLLLEKYYDYLEISDGDVRTSHQLIDEMLRNDESELHILEAEMNISRN